MGWTVVERRIVAQLDSHGGDRQRDAEARWDEFLAKVAALAREYTDPDTIPWLEVV